MLSLSKHLGRFIGAVVLTHQPNCFGKLGMTGVVVLTF
jgi:hypothetical protein